MSPRPGCTDCGTALGRLAAALGADRCRTCTAGARRHRWLTLKTDDGAHVLPLGDTAPHVATADCPCGPAHQLHTDTEGPDLWITSHHALDGRA